MGPLNQSIKQTLPNKNTPLIPKVAFRYDTLASTNTVAVSSIQGSQQPAHGDVFWADDQSAGRGQGVNRWHATGGANLTISVVAYPEQHVAEQLFSLTQITGLAVRETVQFFSEQYTSEAVTVKWPNDVYVGDRKIAGILVQNGLRGEQVSWSVIGIGLNVNEVSFPEHLESAATSLRLLTNKAHNLTVVANYLFQQLSFHYEQLNPGSQKVLAINYHQHLYRRNIPSRFQLVANGQLFQGIIRGVNHRGQLRIEQPVGRESAFSVGEVKLLK